MRVSNFSIHNTHLIFFLGIASILLTPFITDADFVNQFVRPKQYYFFIVLSTILILIAVRHSIQKGNASLKIHTPDIFLLIYYIYCTIHILSDNESLYTMYFFKLTGLVIMYFIIKHRFLSLPKAQLKQYSVGIIMIFMCLSLGEAVYGIIQYMNSNSTFRVHGTFDNPGPYTNYLSAIFPLALG
jgi:hypothetical protein